MGKSNRTIQIKLVVSPEENAQIRKNARACDRTVSAYIREVSLNMCMFRYDHEAITEHTKQISWVRNSINPLVYTILRRGNYVPPDLEYILAKMDALLKTENELLRTTMDMHDDVKDHLEQTVQAIVDRHLSKASTDEH